MRNITPGKYRSLSLCSTSSGVFAIMALDHRNNLRQAINPSIPESVSDDQIIEFKMQAVGCLSSCSSAVLLDPQYGAFQCITSGNLSKHSGLLVSLEATGYTGEPDARESRLLTNWSVSKSKRLGANAVKFLVYYHPDSPTARESENIIDVIASECNEFDIPFFLEPLTYSLDPAQKKLYGDELKQTVIETARRLSPLGADVMKMEFPVDIQAHPEIPPWSSACSELTSACQGIPWVLLSGSYDFDTFLRLVTIACQNGSSGVAVGRAIWREATSMELGSREHFLCQVASQRMTKIMDLVNALAKPWTDYYSSISYNSDWYKGY